jgi:hypothetical protein
VLHLCRALLHGKEPFAVKKGRRVNGEEENHDKTKKSHTTKKHHTSKAQKQRTAKKMARQRPETTHGKDQISSSNMVESRGYMSCLMVSAKA